MRNYETLVNPETEGLLEKTDSKLRLVILPARRARQITSYFGQPGAGLAAPTPPHITPMQGSKIFFQGLNGIIL